MPRIISRSTGLPIQKTETTTPSPSLTTVKRETEEWKVKWHAYLKGQGPKPEMPPSMASWCN